MQTEKHIKCITIRIATGFIGWFMHTLNIKALASNWNVIYVQKQWFDDVRLLNHQLCYTKQIREDGLFWMPLKYVWYCVRYGTKNNPYELQAKKAENRVFLNKGNL